jgi:hypothetical protein
MTAVVSLVLWALVVAGGLPAETQRILESRLQWWSSKWMGLASSILEFLSGLGLLRTVLIMAGLDHLPSWKALLLGAVGLYLLLEGLVRLAITPQLEGVALPSLPVVLATIAINRLLDRS